MFIELVNQILCLSNLNINTIDIRLLLKFFKWFKMASTILNMASNNHLVSHYFIRCVTITIQWNHEWFLVYYYFSCSEYTHQKGKAAASSSCGWVGVSTATPPSILPTTIQRSSHITSATFQSRPSKLTDTGSDVPIIINHCPNNISGTNFWDWFSFQSNIICRSCLRNIDIK